MVRYASCLPRACFSATIPSQCSSHHKRALPHVYPDSLVSNIAETPPVEIGLMICPSQGRMRRDGANVNGESCPRKPALTSSTKRLRTSKSRSRVARQGESQPRSKLKPRRLLMRLRRQRYLSKSRLNLLRRPWRRQVQMCRRRRPWLPAQTWRLRCLLSPLSKRILPPWSSNRTARFRIAGVSLRPSANSARCDVIASMAGEERRTAPMGIVRRMTVSEITVAIAGNIANVMPISFSVTA